MLQSQDKSDKSLGELFGDLARETSTLMRQEVQLARTEITQSIATVIKSAAFLIIAGVLAFVGFLALVAAAILALAQNLPPWEAALIVGGAFLLLAIILALVGVSALKKASLAPKQTIETIKEDAQWAKEQIK